MEHLFEEYATDFSREEECRTTAIDDANNDSNQEEPLTKTSDNIFANIQKFQHEEYQYLHLLENILENGTWEEDRAVETPDAVAETGNTG
jgi:hypothetical protein